MILLFYLLAILALAIGTAAIYMALNPDTTLSDVASGTVWDIRGKYISGTQRTDLVPIALSDEYWFSWQRFHPESRLIRV
jgi:hypothetical protein